MNARTATSRVLQVPPPPPTSVGLSVKSSASPRPCDSSASSSSSSLHSYRLHLTPPRRQISSPLHRSPPPAIARSDPSRGHVPRRRRGTHAGAAPAGLGFRAARGMAASPEGWRGGMSADNVKGLVLALSSSVFIGASFIVKKKGLKKAGASGVRAGPTPLYRGDGVCQLDMSVIWHSTLKSKRICQFRYLKQLRCLSRNEGPSPSSSIGTDKDSDTFSPCILPDARIVYCIAPAMGHNKESHPESNLRVPAIMSILEKMELTMKFRGSDVLELQSFQPASLDDISSVHARDYVLGLEKAMPKASQEGLIFIEGSGPTYATGTTFQESLAAAGAGLSLVDYVVMASRKRSNPPMGFALVRPPGHHAIPDGPMGFCVFGNVAVAARHAQCIHGLKRVFIIDFDVHHGNGTCDAFYDDPDIFFLSTHQLGSYPGTGKIDQIGKGNGEGTTLNLPLPGGSGDTIMRAVFEEIIVPCAQRFKPDIILVSAGYDAHVLDPLAGLQFTTSTYYLLASGIKRLAMELCSGRCVFFLEGGYNLQSLSHSVADTFRAFLGEPSIAAQFDDPGNLYEEPITRARQAIQKAKQIHSL